MFRNTVNYCKFFRVLYVILHEIFFYKFQINIYNIFKPVRNYARFDIPVKLIEISISYKCCNTCRHNTILRLLLDMT